MSEMDFICVFGRTDIPSAPDQLTARYVSLKSPDVSKGYVLRTYMTEPGSEKPIDKPSTTISGLPAQIDRAGNCVLNVWPITTKV